MHGKKKVKDDMCTGNVGTGRSAHTSTSTEEDVMMENV